MRQLLESLGWVKYYECKSCGGKQYWKKSDKAGYEVRVKTKANTFVIVLHNQVIAGSFHAYQLKDQLTKQGLLS